MARHANLWDEQASWSFSMVAEFHMHDAAHCKHWYGKTWCIRHAQTAPLPPSADVPACRDEDPAWAASLAACYPDPPEYQHPEGE